MEGEHDSRENRALADALIAYLSGDDTEDFRPLRGFLNIYPVSRWRASLLTNLGIVYERAGFYSRAMAAFEEAWHLSKDSDEPTVRAMADLAVTELMDLYMPIGDLVNLERLLLEVEGREMKGSTDEKRVKAEGTVWAMHNAHHLAIPSGRVAVERLFALERPNDMRHPQLDTLHPSMEGATLTEVEDLAGRVGLNLQRAYRQNKGQARIPVPSLAHMKGGHFAAVVGERNGRFKLDDPSRGGEIWMSREAFEEESTGYFLIAGGRLPPGWRKPPPQEVDGVRGKCHVGLPKGSMSGKHVSQKGGCNGRCPDKGLAGYTFYDGLASLNITDNPVGYSPPVGPSIDFWLTYNQREATQPQTFTYSNVGHQWTHDFLAYVEDDPSNLGEPVELFLRGGGAETYEGFENNVSEPQLETRAVMTIVSTNPIEYERQLPDGSIEIYAQPDGATAPRKVFLTEWQDPQGNAVTLTYDAQLRLVSVTDAIGQVTTLSYGMLENPLRITKVTDPFGRTAVLEYDEDENLVSITDVIGMTSEFSYGSGYFIRSLTTPYGTTTFRGGNFPTQSLFRYIEATDPLGGTERVEYGDYADLLPSSDPPEDVPIGFAGKNNSLKAYVSVYWDKLAMSLAEGDPNKAVVTKFAHHTTLDLSTYHIVAEKKPLENRVWYAFDGNQGAHYVGPLGRPSKIARVLDDGSSQIYRYEYNSRGMVTRYTDPVGRETLYQYDTNEIDLLNVRQKNPESPGGYDLLATYTYNSQHLPLSATGSSGHNTTFTYNADGQLATMTTPERAGITENRTTTYSYDEDGYLETVSEPATGATTSYTYDSCGRLDTVTDSDDYTLTSDYDALDRVTKITYPDSIYIETIYERLDPVRTRDRLGRWTYTAYDAIQRVTATTDPLGRTATQQWCPCGTLDAFTDPNGNTTRWEYDIQGRMIKEIRADNTEWVYDYDETSSRFQALTDPKDQVKTYGYFLDGNLQGVSYTNEEHDTPNVTFTYDDTYDRVVEMVDGIGTTTYAYNPIGAGSSLGAGMLWSVDGPLTNDTVTYSYDELGRVVGRSINGAAATYDYDALGRITKEVNVLGTFTFQYEDVTSRLQSVHYPNGQTVSYSYYANSGDRRIEEIHHTKADTSTISKFNYGYDAVGNIETWTQQADANPAKAYDFEYDKGDQLKRAVWRTTGATPTVLERYVYGYDGAGNRTVEQVDDAPLLSAYDNVNRLVSLSPGGALRFAGALDEAATVTVQSEPALVAADHTFEGTAEVGSGTTEVVLKAKDFSGNERTNTYEVDVSGSSGSFTFDANGNMTTDNESRTFEWDAENRLIAVNDGTDRSEFSYDGLGMRVRIIDKDDGEVIEDRRFIWCGSRICEERDSTGSGVVKSFFEHGFLEHPGDSYFYTRDHLGSIREVVDEAGGIRARYEYDPYGRTTKSQGDVESDLQYTGHLAHSLTGLLLAPNRAYMASLGRWLSEDPTGGDRTGNLYAYVTNNPAAFVDPLGLFELRYNVTEIYQDDIEEECRNKKTKQLTNPAGACSQINGLALGSCVCEGGKWRGETILIVTGFMYIYDGTFPYKGRNPKDKSVINSRSARNHERRVHIDPATAAASLLLIMFELRRFDTKEKCEKELEKVKKKANNLFNKLLHKDKT
jgi:RHS repeat-associated protein